MQCITLEDFAPPKAFQNKLRQDRELLVLDNDKPCILMIDVSEGSLDEWTNVISKARAIVSIGNMRNIAIKNGYMDEEEIEAEIQSYRNEKNGISQ